MVRNVVLIVSWPTLSISKLVENISYAMVIAERN